MRITQSYKFSPVDKFSLVKLLLACALALCSSCAFAALAQTSPTTNTLAGRVLDPQGAGVAGAVVTLYARSPQLRLTTRADANGAYRFERVAPGEYLLEADAQGFAPASARRVRVERGAAGVTLDLALEVAGVRAEVVVTAADSPQSTDEVSKAITTVGEREIEERNEYSIPEALRTVPGLRVQQLGGPGAFVSIKTRGLRNQDTAVLVDGLRFRDPSSPQGDASGYLSDLLVTGTSRVEVLRGSGSSLYGSNAIGGVVNVVTDEGGAPTHGSLLAEGGSLGLFRGRARLAGGSGANRVAYSVGLSHLYVARGLDGDDGAYNTSGQGRVLFRLTPTATLSARAYAADAFVELNNNPSSVANTFAPNPIIAVPLARDILRLREAGDFEGFRNLRGATFIPSTNDPDATRSTRFFSGALVFNHRPTERFGYTVSYQGNVNNGKFDDGGARDGSIFGPSASFTRLQGRAHTLNARADWQPGGSQLITAGYEFEREWFSNKNVIPTFPELDTAVQVAEHSHTFFIQDQIRLLADRLQLSASFRAQHFTLSAPRFTPDDALSPFANFDFAAPPNAYTGDGSIAYLVRTTGTKLRGHVGNGYRAPSLFERFGSFDSFSSDPEFPTIFFAFGDPRLRPERALAFDAGLDQTLARNRVRASATYFYTRLQEVIEFNNFTPNDPFGRFGGYVNTRGGLARGVELSVATTPTRTLDLTAAYTYTNADERTARLRDATNARRILRSFGISAHQFSLVATQRVGRRVLLNFDLVAASDHLAPVFNQGSGITHAFLFAGIRKADAGASYTWPLAESRSLRFFGYVENLTGHEYFENGFRTPGRTGRAGAQFSF